ncbi:nitrate reductase [Gracilibacillus sp. S3-1-1]|uniref:Nitrate reductase n=1 Tax=Gracilibacillus pellucidus TaxID=3095368 RepID=A0ACC6M4E4_9BACI|nr:nitrate reductase [Gracilibacillus sp. S3-1-1]MDX8045839.1 nitrate reductase [Gracilibacillus sp. S3-1-1]
MINLEQLHQCKEAFAFYSQHLSYPEQVDSPSLFFEENDPGYELACAYWQLVKDDSLDERQERYTETFDFQKEAALYMTYAKLEDSKERGQMLARLKVLYEMFGLDMPKGELSDFLPLMCEFIYAAEWLGDERAPESFAMLFAVIEDGTYHVLEALKEEDSPYYYLIKSLRETMKDCVIAEEVELT